MSKTTHTQKSGVKGKAAYDRIEKKRDIDKTKYISELEEIIISQQKELDKLRLFYIGSTL